jgi:peptidoglycan L-alanyl-D-glutamate endopeptidase CwlK
MNGVDSRLIEIAERAIQITLVDFGIPKDGGKRTAKKQNGLFIIGVSQRDGYIKKSKHQSGKALDIFAYVYNKKKNKFEASWKIEHLALVACAFFQAASELGYKIIWGGLWKNFNDMPHFQIQ